MFAHVATRGPAALLSDGDAVFQPWKVWTSGLYEAVKGRVLIYQAKETCLADVEQRLPAEHYVLFDDKLRIHEAIKASWGKRVTTVFLRQGHYALDPVNLGAYPPADLAFDRIDELVRVSVDELIAAGRR